MINLYFIVEGYSEELFLKNALAPYLKQKNTKNFNYNYLNLGGGIHLPKLIRIIQGNISKYSYVTTFIDLARLHNAKFSNYSTIMSQNIDSSTKATFLEQQLLSNLSTQEQAKFIPHIQPYEFEALCFADADNLARTDPRIAKSLVNINKESRGYNDAESINNQQLPSARLVKYGYIKASSTFSIYCKIDKIRQSCPHFDQWLNKLENII